MTTGTIITDSRQLTSHPVTPGVTFLVGSYHAVSFSGRNSPHNQKTENPFTKSVNHTEDPWIIWSRRLPGAPTQYGNFTDTFGGTFYNWDNFSLITANDDISAISRIGEKSGQTSFNASVTLAESGEALSMIGSTAYSLATAIKKVKRGDMRGAAKAMSVSPRSRNRKPSESANEISGRWLELQYGWLPLIGDVSNAAKAVSQVLNGPMTQSIRTSKSRSTEDTVVHGNYVYVDRKRSHKKYWTVRVKTAVNPFQLSLVDPLMVAWELMPYSFVADWFLPIGDYLSAQKVRQVLPVKDVIISQKLDSYRKPVGYTGSPINNGFVPLNGGELSAFAHQVYFVRAVSADLPSVPLPSFEPLDEVFGYRRAMNAISLLVQRCNR